MELNQFAEEFRQEVLSQCDGEDSAHFREDKFTEVMIDYLKQANEVDDGEVCSLACSESLMSALSRSK